MPLMPFSIPEHIPLLLDGRKVQTTRRPRKNPLKVGDVLYCYYKPRQKRSCDNCLLKKEYGRGNCPPDVNLLYKSLPTHYCLEWSDYFGEAEITEITKVRSVVGSGCVSLFSKWPEVLLEEWAKADGFANLDEADKWFGKSTGLWKMLDWDVILFEPRWLKCQ